MKLNEKYLAYALFLRISKKGAKNYYVFSNQFQEYVKKKKAVIDPIRLYSFARLL